MKMNRRMATIASVLLLGVVIVLFMLNRNTIGDYEAFAQVVAEKPQSYEELEGLMKEYVYDFSDAEKKAFLGEVGPVSGAEKQRLRSARDVEFYSSKGADKVSFYCDVYTFQVERLLFWTIQSLPQNHIVYFDQDMRLVGYYSEWIESGE